MKIHLHDFSGHPFQVQLSRKLAEMGNDVEHTYCAQYVSGKGSLRLRPGDPPSLSISPVTGPIVFKKYSPVARTVFEIAYAAVLWRRISRSHADAVILCNAPLLTTYLQKVLLGITRTPWLFWHQDVYSAGMRDELLRKFPRPLARAVSRVFVRMERACVRDADSVVAIDRAFCRQYGAWGLDVEHVTVIPNWAPVDDIRPVARDNDFSREWAIPRDRLRLLYSGTLGRKHNPLLLLDLLRRLDSSGVSTHLTVVSEGDGVELLRAAADPGDRLTILPYQPITRVSEVLSSADALVALLEPSASRFSIPSKVLSYLAAGRPILGLMPRDNAAAHAVRTVDGAVVDPDGAALAEAVDWLTRLAKDPSRLDQLGVWARSYAEREFDIDVIGERFQVLLKALAQRKSRAMCS